MKLYTQRQRLVRMHGRGAISSFFKDIVSNDTFKNNISKIGRYAGEMGQRGITYLTPIAKNLGKQALDAGLQFVQDESGALASNLTNKAISKLDKKLGKDKTDLLLSVGKTALQKSAEHGLTDKILQGVDKKLNLPGGLKSSTKNIGEAIQQNIANATDNRGRPIANIDEVIKDPKIIKGITETVFKPKREPGERQPDILSNLLAGTGSKRKKNNGLGLYMPGTKPGRGLFNPGMSGRGIAYV